MAKDLVTRRRRTVVLVSLAAVVLLLSSVSAESRSTATTGPLALSFPTGLSTQGRSLIFVTNRSSQPVVIPAVWTVKPNAETSLLMLVLPATAFSEAYQRGPAGLTAISDTISEPAYFRTLSPGRQMAMLANTTSELPVRTPVTVYAAANLAIAPGVGTTQVTGRKTQLLNASTLEPCRDTVGGTTVARLTTTGGWARYATSTRPGQACRGLPRGTFRLSTTNPPRVLGYVER